MPTEKEILELYNKLSKEQREEIDDLIRADINETLWRPLIDIDDPGKSTPQQLALDSLADIILFGGAAGGGKTTLVIGMALVYHTRSAIFRREVKQVNPLAERIIKMRKTRDGYNGQLHRFDLGKNRSIQLDGMQHPGDEVTQQGIDRDFMAFDELTQFLESQFRYVLTWNRSDDPSQRSRVVCTSNPPTTAEGQWVISFWAPWLDPEHPNPAKPGELRWFVSDEEGKDKELSGPDEIVLDAKGERLIPRSRTFIPSNVEDNPFLIATGYKASLQALPEPLRSQMLQGDFLSLMQDDPWQVIPTEWVEAAQERWIEFQPKGSRMDSLGVDPARGGQDKMVLSPRYGNWFAPQIVRKGIEIPDGPTGAALCMSIVRDGAAIHIDIIGGAGASIYDHLVTNNLNTVKVDGRNLSNARDATGSLSFYNKRAENWWRMREALDPNSHLPPIMLPRDRELKADLCAPRWQLTSKGIQVEGKYTEMKDGFGDLIKRLGRSPDKGDAVVNALLEGKNTRPSGGFRPARQKTRERKR